MNTQNLSTEEEIFTRYRQYAVVESQELYIGFPHAFDFLATCRSHNLAVIGVEGFRYEEGAVHALMDAIADFSECDAADWQMYMHCCNTAAEQFLHHLAQRSEVVVTFVVLSQAETNLP